MASAEHEKLTADLSAYLDGELSADRRAEVERLMESSAEARRDLEQLRRVSQRLSELPRPSLPSDLSEVLTREFDQRPPAMRGFRRPSRVVRVFLQISASAALIAVGAIATWTVMQQPDAGDAFVSAERSPVQKQQPDVSAPALVMAEPPAAARRLAAREDVGEVRQLEALGYVGFDDEAEQEDSAPMIAMAPAPAPDGVPGLPRESFAGGREGKSAAVESDLSAEPAVSVVVSPRDAREYGKTLAALNEWQTSHPQSGGVQQAGDEYRGAGDEKLGVPLVAQQLDLEIAPERVSDVLLSLERQAPEGVQVAMVFPPNEIAQVRQMVTPATVGGSAGAFADQSTPASPAIDGRRGGAGDGPERAVDADLDSLTVEDSIEARDRSTVSAERNSGEQRRKDAFAYRSPKSPSDQETPAEGESAGARGADQMRRAAPADTPAAGQKRDTARADEAKSSTKGSVRRGFLRFREVDKTPPAAETEESVGAGVAMQSSLGEPRGQVFEALRESIEKVAIGLDHALQSLELAATTLWNGAVSPAPQKPQPVRLRVTLLPPATQTTQPAHGGRNLP